jgi:hypothetical protein
MLSGLGLQSYLIYVGCACHSTKEVGHARIHHW